MKNAHDYCPISGPPTLRCNYKRGKAEIETTIEVLERINKYLIYRSKTCSEQLNLRDGLEHAADIVYREILKLEGNNDRP